jgi:hypothetical protein
MIPVPVLSTIDAGGGGEMGPKNAFFPLRLTPYCWDKRWEYPRAMKYWLIINELDSADGGA